VDAVIEERLAALEKQAARLEVRTRRLERRSRGREPLPLRREPHPTPGPLSPAAPAERPRDEPRRDGRPHDVRRRALPGASVEDLLGGRVLGWLGGIAVLTGLLFLLVMAASRGWIGEEARVLMAAVAALALTGAGVWLRERRDLRDVALAAAASGCAGLFAAVVVAGPVYDLVPALVALGAALAVGAATTGLALRWRAQGMGWLGLLGAIAAPVLVGATGDAAIALMLAAYVATAAIGLWQRWHAIAFAAFLLATAQIGVWMAADAASRPAATLAALAVLGLATAVAAAGFEWRARTPQLRTSAVVLLCLNALALAALGTLVLTAPAGWLLALAVAHVAGGLLARRTPRVSRELAVVGLALGVLMTDAAFAGVADGLPLVLGWAAGAAGFAALARVARHRADDVAALAGLGGHGLLALATAVTSVAPASALGGPADGTALAALAALAAAAWTAARLLPGRHDRLAGVLDGVAVVLLVAWSAVALDGAALTVALAAEAAALAAVARREQATVPGGGAPVPLYLGVLAIALAHGVAVLAPPESLLDGLDAVVPAVMGLGAVVAAALLAARGSGSSRIRTALVAGAGLTVLGLASALVLTPFEPAEQGQPLMSALWALAGVALLVAGLVRDAQPLRLAGLALLGAAAAKVFLADLTSLVALYRVGSFLALGLLLLLGGYAWARLRPTGRPAGPRAQYP
jgi:uncharacterized membrane protein